MNKLVACVGMAGSGKTIATSYLEEKGWTKIYFGGVVLDRVKELNLELTPENEKKVRVDLRKEHGMGVVALFLLDKIKESLKQNDVILDGLASWEEYLVLKEAFPELKIVAVICDKKTRYERISKRTIRPFNNEDIHKRDIGEIQDMNKGGPIVFADYYIDNNNDFNNYYKRLEEILKDLEEEII